MSAKVISIAGYVSPDAWVMSESYLDGLVETLRAECGLVPVPLSVAQFNARLRQFEAGELK